LIEIFDRLVKIGDFRYCATEDSWNGFRRVIVAPIAIEREKQTATERWEE